jgi:hypothetical protein
MRQKSILAGYNQLISFKNECLILETEIKTDPFRGTPASKSQFLKSQSIQPVTNQVITGSDK